MITVNELRELVAAWGLEEQVIEKDYCLGWALKGIASHPELKDSWVFKGGTCLKKCYIETYRFSEDLDFTVLDQRYMDLKYLAMIFGKVSASIEAESGIRFTSREPVFRMRGNDPANVEGKFYYIGPRNTPKEASIKLDLNAREKLVDAPVYNEISHPYSDAGHVITQKVRCYSFNELFAEKIRAMGERCRPRDLYDIINLFRRDDFRKNPDVINGFLRQKCSNKGIPLITHETIAGHGSKDELISEWENMLGHQLPVLPPFESFWNELPLLFEWLDKGVKAAPLPSMPAAGQIPPVSEVSSFTSGRERYYGYSLEAVRFAAVNRLFVRLGYDGSYRFIEPYSLRKSREGNTLLCAVKENGDSRSYRVERIQSVEVTNRPFIPKFAVEFPAAGRISAPLIQKERTSFGVSSARSKKPRLK
ncbi:MAG TPA: hypothetical protein ENN43_03410 [bacterium]|nr:hypothetical protein [bacterium]